MPAKKSDPAVEPVESITPPAEPVAPIPVLEPSAPVPSYTPPLSSGLGKPGMVQTLAIMTIINGILNILYGVSVTTAIVLGTFFLGILCAPISILPVVLGIFEIIYAIKLFAIPPQPVKPSQTLAILEIVAVISGNIISAVVGVLALVFYTDANVKSYFARLNGQSA